MTDGFEFFEKDFGLNALVSRSKKEPDVILVGVLDDSPRDHFKKGKKQQFRNSTGELLLSGVDEKSIGKLVSKACVEGVLKGKDAKTFLEKAGLEVQKKMRGKTDDPDWGGGSLAKRGQLGKAIIIK